MNGSTQKKPTINARLAAAKTAYFTVSKSETQGHQEALEKVRKAFPHLRIGAYPGEFESSKDWRDNFPEYIADVDVLIVGCDSSRITTSGVIWEIGRARKAGRLIILFKLDDNQLRPYYGYQQTGKGKNRKARFYKKAEKIAEVRRWREAK